MDLDGYLDRIGLTRAAVAAPTLDTLAAVAWAHVSSIPFENLDILLGRPIRIDLPSVEAKLVGARRGGYCFEQNTLLAAALTDLGFAVTTLSARVRWGATAITARTHMLLRVLDHVVDVGFGGNSPTAPIPLRAGEIQLRHERVRLSIEGDLHVLQLWLEDAWIDLYAFTLEPQHAIDFEVANHFTSTHPSSHFRRGPTIARTTAAGRTTLRGDELTIRRGDEVTKRTISDPDELLAVLDAELGLPFPPGTRFGREP